MGGDLYIAVNDIILKGSAESSAEPDRKSTGYWIPDTYQIPDILPDIW